MVQNARIHQLIVNPALQLNNHIIDQHQQDRDQLLFIIDQHKLKIHIIDPQIPILALLQVRREVHTNVQLRVEVLEANHILLRQEHRQEVILLRQDQVRVIVEAVLLQEVLAL